MRLFPRASGMTLVEVVVGIGIMLVIFLALFGLLQISLQLANLTKAKAVATELAINQLEQLRTRSYTSLSVGTQATTTTVNGGAYAMQTILATFDDAADGTGAADTDGNTADYLKAQVEVTYQTSRQSGSVVLTSNIAPPSP
jgi:type II secretory pathway pseudopilin PulG